MIKDRINAINHCLASAGIIIIGIVLTMQAEIVIPLLRIITLCALSLSVFSSIKKICVTISYMVSYIFYSLS